MNQVLYSNIVLNYLKDNHSEFLENIDFKEDHSFDCSIKSISGSRSLWIATYNLELTLGFENHESKCDWHIHIGASAGNNLLEELNKLTEEIDGILNNQKMFVLEEDMYLPIHGNDEEDIKHKGNVKFFNWSKI
ncbi:hypothetical protein [Flavobacterium sp. LC2016-12]|uniref:hypothetical protein n=1 Tax=Flavobacterium sp. LC2016-12 TaxID=2783794 RepID=UPI00188AB748|nr:hypothetical protein [Flavobacterium sp. LC2016-12]MBF4464605.1 hypothetical protein [Flavobacterium sp. LC2016-12]